MLAKEYRLRRASEFGRVREKGRCWSDQRLVLCACENGLDRTRFAVITSKRIGNAVTRNRVRRLVSEALRLQRDLVSPGWDVVVIARTRVRQADYWAVERSVTHLLSMGRLYGEDRPRGSVSTGKA